MSFRSLLLLLAASLLAIPLLLSGGCSSDADASGKGTLEGNLEGAGASFPEPLYQIWFRKYHDEAQSGVRINYTGQGSSKGVRSVIENTCDFGASDAAMKDSEIEQVDPDRGILMLPVTAGAVVVAYKAPIDGLRLDRGTLAGIFMGEITRWDDAAIAATNGGKDLPDAAINVCVRSDGSGTTYAFSNHLSAIDDAWRSNYGVAKSIEWPTSFKQFNKNVGVTQAIQGTENSIGYIEYSYAKAAGLKTAVLQNKAGNFIEPTMESFQEALAGEPLPENMRLFIHSGPRRSRRVPDRDLHLDPRLPELRGPQQGGDHQGHAALVPDRGAEVRGGELLRAAAGERDRQGRGGCRHDLDQILTPLPAVLGTFAQP